jgi:hypothetical protein
MGPCASLTSGPRSISAVVGTRESGLEPPLSETQIISGWIGFSQLLDSPLKKKKAGTLRVCVMSQTYYLPPNSNLFTSCD